ncbi:acVLRF1 family peptidyl-tRNA hydrolase [uncultured Arthrobacter sp.]|uniref:acVLRF1 family peptidyl-tRNA hydrolase n=1 Tax=uncultured Arthrobacter sp. TaxID=114050 RepID=UPI0026373EF7|nr:acVLRF1 family peptidyl-tRNA hydrolase [uncultured Arthrobacter sp.]
MQDNRSVLVPPERLAGWVQRFGDRNGAFSAEQPAGAPGVLILRAANGCTAEITTPLAAFGQHQTAGESVSCEPRRAVKELIRQASVPVTVGLLLIRRGGYGVGLARKGTLIASKNGTRYVQSRTAAGGWSQQRFARRRANQADALVETAAERAAALFAERAPDCLQPGGDAKLFSECVAHVKLAPYRVLPRLPLLPVPDPRQNVLRQAAADARALRISLTGIPAG